jgi:hypothetical protein
VPEKTLQPACGRQAETIKLLNTEPQNPHKHPNFDNDRLGKNSKTAL